MMTFSLSVEMSTTGEARFVGPDYFSKKIRIHIAFSCRPSANSAKDLA